jgi:hypothetical protein
MTTFFPGNAKLIGIAKQVDADTPAAAPTVYLEIRNWNKDAVRAQAALEETDRSAQQGAQHVTAITPGLGCDLYLRPSQADLIAKMLLWDNDDSATGPTYTHSASPSQVPVFYTVWEIEPGLYTNRYDGAVAVAGTYTGQDEGQTEINVTGLTFIALGFTAHVAEPTLPSPNTELPFIYAEAAISYGGVHPKTTSAFTVNVNRNAKRITGDNGFRSLAVAAGKLQVDGTLTRYVQDDDTARAVDTGTAGGSAPTTTVFTESLAILLERSGSLSSLIASLAVAYPTREQAINLDGSPLAEVLGFATQPETDVADNISIVSVNAKATPEAS